MIDTGEIDRRRVFSVWLRTGRLPTEQADGIEIKFNPYHDPRNGEFAFAAGGPRSLSRVVISHRRSRPGGPGKLAEALRPASDSVNRDRGDAPASIEPTPILSEAVYRRARRMSI